MDPETFASLILVDHAWRAASQTPHLYAYHLSRCPSFSLNHNVLDAGPFTESSLQTLKKKFAQEVRRNLFEAYLQPRRTVVSLVSTTTTSSAAFPAGEAFDFVFSPNGHWTLALSSSRIYVIDTVSPKIGVRRELKVLRRPVSAAILDDGSTLAVLSSNQHVHVYSLADLAVKHVRSILLENAAHAIVVAPKGDILAIAHDSGIDVYSLSRSSSASDWRNIKTERVDSLKFSADGTTLLGTTHTSHNPNTVVLTAPYYTDDNQELPRSDQISQVWTSQIIFPNSSRDCSHATLLPNRSDGDASWTFTYDRVFESFRAVRTDDLRNGTTYFTGPQRSSRQESRASRRNLVPCTLPSPSAGSELVAAGFSKKDVWVYGVPEGLDTASVVQTDEAGSQAGSSAGPSTPSRTPSGGKGNPPRSLTRGEASELIKLPKWQVLVDKYRNIFAKGRRVAEIPGVSAMSWVTQPCEASAARSLKERLIIAAPGGVPEISELEQGSFAANDGGRLIILDFDRTIEDGKIEEMVFEVGDAVPELLVEDNVDIDTQVAIARQRTVRREATDRRTIVELASPPPAIPSLTSTANAPANVEAMDSSNDASSSATSVPLRRADSLDEEGLSLEQAAEVFGGPYSQSQPRSRDTLHRSATAVVANRRRHPPPPLMDNRTQYRRPGDRAELPHESDADNWVPPPPPYALRADPKSNIPLPQHLQTMLLPRSEDGAPTSSIRPERPRRTSTMHETLRSAGRRSTLR